jgi:phosphoribosylaminoimidazole (AIR) synthetase
MYRVFNMGIGMVAVIGADQLTEAQRILPEGKPIGQIQAGEGVQLTGLK